VAGSQAFLFLLLSIPGGVYATVYRAVGMFTRGAMVGNVFRLVTVGVSAALLLSSAGPVVFALGTLGVSAALTGYIVFDTRRVIPESRKLVIGLGPAIRGWSRLAGGAWHFWLIAVAQAINQQGIVLIIAGVLTPEAVAVYTTHRTLASIPGYVSALVQGPVMPELSALWAKKRMEELRHWALGAVRLVVVATGIGGLAVWVATPLIYRAWTNKRLEVAPFLLGLLICQAVLAAGWSTSVWSMLAANRHRTVARWWLANAGVTLALAGLFTSRFGLSGATLGSLLGDLACGLLIFPALISQFLALPAVRTYREILSSFFLVIPIVGIALAARLLFAGWWSVLAVAVLLALLAYPLAHLTLGKADMQRLHEAIRIRWLESIH
jgi:O-antigen/teichoic acid export membrane protein